MDAYFKKRDRKCRMALLAATAMLAVAMAGFLVADTDDSDAAVTTWSVEKASATAIAHGDMKTVSALVATHTQTATITAADGYFVPTSESAVTIKFEEGVFKNDDVTHEYKPANDRKTATLKVTIKDVESTAEVAKVQVTCAMEQGAAIKFVVDPTTMPAINTQYGPLNTDKVVTFTTATGGGIVEGYNIKECSIGTDKYTVTNNSFTIEKAKLTTVAGVEVKVAYEAQKYKIEMVGTDSHMVLSKTDITYGEENVRVTITPEKLKDASGKEYSVYHAPSTARITSGSVSYEYKTAGTGNETTGYFVIPKVTGNVSVSCTGAPNVYSITYIAKTDGDGDKEVFFKDRSETLVNKYTYNVNTALPDKNNNTMVDSEGEAINEYIFERCYEIVEGEKKTVLAIPAGTYGDQEVLVEVIDNMDYAETLYRNIEIALCLVAAAIMAIAMVVRVR